MMLRSLRLRSRASIALVVVVAVIVGLHALATLGLRGPSGYDRAALDSWISDPIIALATVLRWLALVLAYYLLAVIVAVVAVAGNLDASPLRHVIPSRMAGSIGLLLGLTAVALPVASHIERSPSSTVALDHSPPTLEAIDAPPTLERIDPGVGARDSATRVTAHAPSSTLADADSDLADADSIWVVEPGDSFWTIAEEQLIEAWGTDDLSEAEIAGYWRTLITANNDRLVEAGNPDLLYPGQSLELPETPQR